MLTGRSISRHSRRTFDPILGKYRDTQSPSLVSPPTSTTLDNGRAKVPRSLTSPYLTQKWIEKSGSGPSSVRSSSDNSRQSVTQSFKTRSFKFRSLPARVHSSIVHQLQLIHYNVQATSCHTCYARDLCSLALVNIAWNQHVVKALSVPTTCPLAPH